MKSTLKALIGDRGRHLYYRIRHCPPPGLKRLGFCSFIRRPSRVHGAHRIAIGDRTQIGHECWLNAVAEYRGARFSPDLVIGDDVYIGSFCTITCADGVAIGNGCVLSEQVYISDCTHGLDPTAGNIMAQPLALRGRVVIGDGSFLGYRASILPGVTLGKHCVVGTNAVVTKSFPDYSMVAGVPAKLIKTYSHETGEWTPVNP